MLSRKNRKSSKQKYKYVDMYSKMNVATDEKKFSEAMQNGVVDFSSFKRLMINDLCWNTSIINDGCIGNVKLEDAIWALKYPKQGWRVLLSVSEQLMRISPHYYRLNSLFSNMALFCYGLDLYDVKENVNTASLKRTYNSLATKLETMNLKHEFAKIMEVLPYKDIYCGFVYESSSDYYIQQVDFRHCKLYEIEDGLYNFAFNLDSIKPNNLNAYPLYIQQAYLDKRDGKISNWYLPPSDMQICIKLNSQWTYPYPMLIGLIKDILDLDIYKKLKLQSARTDNYKAIAVKVPIDESTIDKPLLTPDVLGMFAEINRESMPDDVGLIHVLGSDAKSISFKDSANTRNNVSDAVDAMYDNSGISKEMFNGSSSATAVTLSIENDAGFIYRLYRQFERWVNRFIKIRKYNKSSFKFSFYLLDMTIFNRDTVTGRYKDSIAFGTPVIDKYLASLNMTPSKILGSYVLHEQIFDFNKHFVPLQTSYNSSITQEDAGRPSSESKGELLSESGEQTKDNDANADR